MHLLYVSKLYSNLEDLSKELFRKAGYKVGDVVDIPTQADFHAYRSEEDCSYLVECKVSLSLDYKAPSLLAKVVSELCEAASLCGATPVLMVFALVSERQRGQYTALNKELKILDIANILFSVQSTSLEEKILASLPYATDQIDRCNGEIDLSFMEHDDKALSIKRRLENCASGKKSSKEFENACEDALRYVFAPDLTLFHSQQSSNVGLFRFDLLSRIKDGTTSTFWRMVENHFHSKYIVFEFKNYSDPINQSEVYTTERYLFSKALRCVAIIIAQNGFNEHAEWAAKGSLREQGKLILLLTTEDLLAMIDLRMDDEDPSQFLLEKVDDLLTKLEK